MSLRTTDGWLVPDEYVEVILDFLKNNGALNPNITSIMILVSSDSELKKFEKVYSIEYTSANTTQLQNINIGMNYIKSVIRDKKISKILNAKRS